MSFTDEERRRLARCIACGGPSDGRLLACENQFVPAPRPAHAAAGAKPRLWCYTFVGLCLPCAKDGVAPRADTGLFCARCSRYKCVVCNAREYPHGPPGGRCQGCRAGVCWGCLREPERSLLLDSGRYACPGICDPDGKIRASLERRAARVAEALPFLQEGYLDVAAEERQIVEQAARIKAQWLTDDAAAAAKAAAAATQTQGQPQPAISKPSTVQRAEAAAPARMSMPRLRVPAPSPAHDLVQTPWYKAVEARAPQPDTAPPMLGSDAALLDGAGALLTLRSPASAHGESGTQPTEAKTERVSQGPADEAAPQPARRSRKKRVPLTEAELRVKFALPDDVDDIVRRSRRGSHLARPATYNESALFAQQIMQPDDGPDGLKRSRRT